MAAQTLSNEYGASNPYDNSWSGICVFLCLLIAGILRISEIMLVGCVCHSVYLSVCLSVCLPCRSHTVSAIMTKLGTDVGHGPT